MLWFLRDVGRSFNKWLIRGGGDGSSNMRLSNLRNFNEKFDRKLTETESDNVAMPECFDFSEFFCGVLVTSENFLVECDSTIMGKKIREHCQKSCNDCPVPTQSPSILKYTTQIPKASPSKFPSQIPKVSPSIFPSIHLSESPSINFFRWESNTPSMSHSVINESLAPGETLHPSVFLLRSGLSNPSEFHSILKESPAPTEKLRPSVHPTNSSESFNFMDGSNLRSVTNQRNWQNYQINFSQLINEHEVYFISAVCLLSLLVISIGISILKKKRAKQLELIESEEDPSTSFFQLDDGSVSSEDEAYLFHLRLENRDKTNSLDEHENEENAEEDLSAEESNDPSVDQSPPPFHSNEPDTKTDTQNLTSVNDIITSISKVVSWENKGEPTLFSTYNEYVKSKLLLTSPEIPQSQKASAQNHGMEINNTPFKEKIITVSTNIPENMVADSDNDADDSPLEHPSDQDLGISCKVHDQVRLGMNEAIEIEKDEILRNNETEFNGKPPMLDKIRNAVSMYNMKVFHASFKESVRTYSTGGKMCVDTSLDKYICRDLKKKSPIHEMYSDTSLDTYFLDINPNTPRKKDLQKEVLFLAKSDDTVSYGASSAFSSGTFSSSPLKTVQRLDTNSASALGDSLLGAGNAWVDNTLSCHQIREEKLGRFDMSLSRPSLSFESEANWECPDSKANWERPKVTFMEEDEDAASRRVTFDESAPMYFCYDNDKASAKANLFSEVEERDERPAPEDVENPADFCRDQDKNEAKDAIYNIVAPKNNGQKNLVPFGVI